MRPYQNIWGNPKIAKSASLGAFVDIGGDVEIGKLSKVQCFVSIPPGIKIGENVFIGPGVHFANDKHPKAQGEWEELQTIVEDNAVIGMGALIGPGIKIGKGAVIGMGAVVTKDVPAGETWIGNPAKKYEKH